MYGAAHGAERRRVHAALAAAAADLGTVELEAWHAAKATLGHRRGGGGPAGARRRPGGAARGGFASRASVLAQAAALTPDGPLEYARLVAAAEAALAAGAAQLAKSMLDEVDEDAARPAVARDGWLTVRASVAMFTADPALRHVCGRHARRGGGDDGHDVAAWSRTP